MQKKYFHEGEDVHKFINRVCSIYSEPVKDKLKQALYNADFCPAGRILYGAGSKGKFKATTSNCFILPAIKEDSIEGIFDLAREMARTFSYGGGVGTTISTLRPKGAKTNNSAKTSTGAVSFLNILNEIGNVIGSNGRRSATMIGLDCEHPDLPEFLKIKENETKLASMNISILFTDAFMEAVQNHDKFLLHFYVPETDEKIEQEIDAYDFFVEFCKVNADWGDPGALFKDRMQKYNLLSGYPEYKINISNPCGEYIGNDYNSCLLSSINLYNIVDNKFTSEAEINFGKLESLVRLGINVLDETLDYGLELLPLDEQKKCAIDWRAIGLGVFGLADMFVAMGIKYGSKESIELVSRLFDFINAIALDESSNLAHKYGTFAMYDWEKTKESPMIKSLLFNHADVYNKIKEFGLRNGTVLSVAPTGSISLLMGGFSGGVEPLFKLCYERTTHSMEDKGQKFRVFSKSVHDFLEFNNIPFDSDLDELKKQYPFLIESHEVEPLNRVHLQSIMQEYVDNAISSTVNLPKNTSIDTILKIYVEAWKQGCKGITVFVDGCKRGSILGVTNEKEAEDKIVYDSVTPVSRRTVDEISGVTYRVKTACSDKMYVTINKTSEGDIFEVFVNASGGCVANLSTITRQVSTALRSGIKVEKILKDLSNTQCPACQALRRKGDTEVALSCGNAIADCLRKAYAQQTEPNNEKLLECPECHKKTLKLEAHCCICSNCGYSTCN